MPGKKNWIKKAVKRPGVFKKKVRAAGKSTPAYARQVLRAGSKASSRKKKRKGKK